MRGSTLSSVIFRRLMSTGCRHPCFAPTAASSARVPLDRTSDKDQGQQQTDQEEPKKRGLLWWSAVSLGIGTLVGGGLGYDKLRKMRTIVANENNETPIILTSVPVHKPSRTMIYPTDMTGLKLTLFQYQTCPFCCKVRAMLDYFGISYDIVEVNPVLRSQTKWTTYKKVPILVVQTPQGEILQLNDSSMIVSALYSFLFASSHDSQGAGASSSDPSSLLNIAKCYPSIKYNDDDGRRQVEIMNKYFLMLGDAALKIRSKEDIMEERKWRRWADSVYVHTLSPNIYRTMPEAIESFKNFDRVGEWEKNFSTWERYLVIYVGAMAMWIIGKRLKKRHNLKDDVRQSLFDESDFWVKSIKQKGGRFMGGNAPNLADLAVYGVLSSIEGCQAFDELMRNSKAVERWYRGVQGQLKEPQKQGAPMGA